MKIPFILTYDSEKCIPQYVFEDLKMNSWLSSDCLRIFAHPCNATEIARRQELFRLLESENYRDLFEKFTNSLHELEKKLRAFYKEKQLIIKLIHFSNLIKQYRISLSELQQLQGCAITNDLIFYWFDEEHNQFISHLDELETMLSPFVFEISQLVLSIGPQFVLSKNEKCETFKEQLEKHASGLGFSARQTTPKSITLDTDFIDRYFELFSCDIMASLLHEMSEISLSNIDIFSSYLTHCRIILEINEILLNVNNKNIPICYPNISSQKCFVGKKMYDITLFFQGVDTIIPNDVDFSLNNFYFLTGANSGGKTTYLRCLAVNLILYLSGCPIFANSATIFPFQNVLTHFPSNEDFNEMGRLEEEIFRVEKMISNCTSDTFFFFNETYSGTNDQYGCDLAIKTAEKISEKKQYGLFVTHFLNVQQSQFPILEAVVEKNKSNHRTFIIQQRKGIGLSYAADILKKYHLDAESLSARRIKCH